ncbi:hypothetical protein [Herbaspirillum rubrisubalbicans]|uniref:Uncharacterized protein n=1 Tax=Herbaspirillum rubrisubalbicans TaxID=80842 RepID=A0AAD0XIA2_9BURK|nr:hypothetical protein [Herbaspirillum rubrisubalbicans]AYR25639.1 hypothetical protein RC54_18245 [Herbaspirillum rubrisubalbicans]
MKHTLLSLLDKTLDALPLTGAAIGMTLLACIFSDVLHDLLLRADMDLLAAAVALLPLSAVLLAFGLSMREQPRKPPRRLRQRELARRQALLRATYDLDEHP